MDNDTTDSEQETADPSRTLLETYNDAMVSLSTAADLPSPSPLTFQLQEDWESATQQKKKTCVEKATEACKLICGIIAPNDEEKLLEALQINKEEDAARSLLPLITAYVQAPTKCLKTQILSIYAYEYPIPAL